MDKKNSLACQIQSQQNWEAPSETNTRSSQTDVSFIIAVLRSVCLFLNKSVNFWNLCHKAMNTDSNDGLGQNRLVNNSTIKVPDENKQNRLEQTAISPSSERCSD